MALLLLLWRTLHRHPHWTEDPADSTSWKRNGANARDLIPSLKRRLCRIGHTARIVEIEKHRWAARHRLEQIAEFAERMRSDDVLIEVDEVVRLGRALGSVDVEVILPEVSHHFLELSLAGDRARDTG